MESSYNKQFSQKALKQAEKLEDVTNYGLWCLGRRDHSIQELRLKLGRKTANSAWIEAAINKLNDLGYLNEQRFVENFVKNYQEIKNYGPLRIRQELKHKRADSDIVNLAMEQSEFDYFEAARKYLNLKEKNPIEDKKKRDRLTSKMLNKGFSFDMIRYAFEKHLLDDE